MKTAEANIASSTVHLQKKENQSFFSKDGRGSFFSKSNEGLQSFFSASSIQPKLTIGQPNDKYEQEADAVADKVVQRLSENETGVSFKKGNSIQAKPVVPPTSFTPLVQAKCAACEDEDKLQKKEEDDDEIPQRKLQKKAIFESNEDPSDDPSVGRSLNKSIQRKCGACEKEEKLQRKESSINTGIQLKCAACEKEEKLQKKTDASSQSASPDVEKNLSASKGRGTPLPSATRSQMENSFGADFSNVRIHNDSSAASLSKHLNAQAFTHGSDIYFNSGKYDTNTSSGQHLLTHELTHTIQQNASKPGLAKKDVVQRLCDHSKCSGDPVTPSCPNPIDFLLNAKLYEIRYSVFVSVKNPAVLRKGESHEAVALIKRFLLNTHCEGYNRLAVETEPELQFGAETKNAVKYFQVNHKDSNGDPLEADGVIGPATLGAMDREMGLSPVPLPKTPEGKGRCFGVAEHGPGLTKKWDTTSPDYLKIPPFFPAVQAWEISNFDIAKFFLKTEHREFLRSTVVPDIKDAVSKSKNKLKVKIIGEASTTASNAFNMKLSFNRAMCLRDALIESGLDAALIQSPVTPLGEELARFMPMLRGQALFPVDEVEDLTERRVSIVLQGPDKPQDCDKTKSSTKFYVYIACRTPNTYLINIMEFSDPAMPMYREFVWGHDDDTTGCDFKPGFSPRSVFKIEANASLQLAKKDPDNPIAESDFQGPTLHYYDDKGMTIQKLGVIPPFVLPVPGDWKPLHCEKQNVLMTGDLNPIGPVKCGMMPVPPASDKCKADADCPPKKRQRPAKKFVATMKWISMDIIKLLKKISWVKKVTKKIDDILDFFGIDINTSVTAAYIEIGTSDEKDNPVKRRFYFIGGEITGSSVPLIDVSSVYAEEFTLDDPKKLETSGGDSDFGGGADLTIKGGTNHQELNIHGIGKPIIFKGLMCVTGGDNKVTGYLKTGAVSCALLETVSRSDKTCEESKDDCSDSQKLKEEDKFLVKTGRATIADLPVAGKKLADKLGCGVTAAFINIGTVTGDEKERIYRKFIFVGKNHDCRYNVEKGSEQKDFLVSRALTYPDPNDTFSLSDFSGVAKLEKDSNLLIISPQNFPVKIKLPGLFDGNCPNANAEGFVIPVSAVDCGMVPDPSHSTTPDITDLNRCEDFKKNNLALVTSALDDLAGKYSKVVSDITDPPRLIYPLYNNLFYQIGQSITNAVFFGKAYDGQKVITVVDMQVISVYPDSQFRYVFTVKFLAPPCSFNEAGEPAFVLPKDCKEAYITVQGDYQIYPLPDDKDSDQNQQQNNDAQKEESPTDNDKCHADCHSLGIIPGEFSPPSNEKLKSNPLSPHSGQCSSCHFEEIQKKENPNGSRQQKTKKPVFESNEGHDADQHIQRKCAECKAEEKLQMKPAGDISYHSPVSIIQRKPQEGKRDKPSPVTSQIKINLSMPVSKDDPAADYSMNINKLNAWELANFRIVPRLYGIVSTIKKDRTDLSYVDSINWEFTQSEFSYFIASEILSGANGTLNVDEIPGVTNPFDKETKIMFMQIHQRIKTHAKEHFKRYRSVIGDQSAELPAKFYTLPDQKKPSQLPEAELKAYVDSYLNYLFEKLNYALWKTTCDWEKTDYPNLLKGLKNISASLKTDCDKKSPVVSQQPQMPIIVSPGKTKKEPTKTETRQKDKVQKKLFLKTSNNERDNMSSENIESDLQQVKGQGGGLPSSVQSQMENSFGEDFSNVRIHHDNDANQMSKTLNAQAFTHGNDIFFNSGKYDTATKDGKQLLAHELTHVVQQRDGKSIQRLPGDKHDLTATELSGDPVLERVFDNEALIQKFKNSKGDHVRKIQEALMRLGIKLPVHGADSDFGKETETAVKEFQQRANMSLGEQDGIVGRKTIELLDRSLRNNIISNDTDEAKNDFSVEDEKKDDSCKGKATDQSCPDPNTEVIAAADEAIKMIEKVEKEQLPPVKNKKADYPKIFDTIFRNNDKRDVSSKVAEVKAIYEKVKDFISTLKTDKKLVRCGTECDGGCRSGSPAYHTPTKEGGHVITICPGFDKNKERILIIIHESHHAAIPGSSDKAYAETRLFEKLDHTKALLNAASFHVYAAWVDTPGSQPIGPKIKDTNLINDKSQKANVDDSLAFMHQWFKLVPFDISQTVQGAEEAKEKGKYTRNNPRIFMEAVFSKWFGLTKPPTVPNATDIKKLRAIEERINTMEDAFKLPFIILETTDQSFWSTGPGPDIALNENVLKLDAEHMAMALLEELVHATPKISAEIEALYVGTINDMRNLRNLDP